VASILYWQGQGKTLTMTFEEYKHPKPIDTRTGDEIATSIIKGIGLKLE
jgi:hypothetical protein